MPKRISTRRVTGGPQGEDAYVVIKSMTWGESQEMLKRFTELQVSNGTVSPDLVERQNAELNGLLSHYVVGWNWVSDEAGEQPLPQPTEGVEVFGQLLNTEVEFLVQSLQGNLAEEKKEPSLND